MIDITIWNIEENENINKAIIDLEIYNNNETINYEFEIDLNLMGLTTDDDYVEELGREIRRFINDFYDDYKRIPNEQLIKAKLESKNWLETKVWLELN